MNTLSWFIYFGGTADHMIGFFAFLAVVCGLGGIAFMVGYSACIGDVSYNLKIPENMAERARLRSARFTSIRWCATGLLIFGLIAAMIPSRQTMILIAASQIGEKIVTNERVTSVVDPSIDLLKAWMVSETQKIKESMEKPAVPAKESKVEKNKPSTTDKLKDVVVDSVKEKVKEKLDTVGN